MKTLNHIFVLLLAFYLSNQLNPATNAQPTFANQGFLTLNTVPNPDEIEYSWNRNDPNLIFWSNFDLSVGLSFNQFLEWGLPDVISGHWNWQQIDGQTTSCIADWDSYMCIDQFNCFNMGYNLTGNSVQLEFRTEPQFFTNAQTTLATTRLAVIEENDVYEFKLYHQFSLTYTQQTQIYFNNCEDFLKFWSVAESYVDPDHIPIKPVILHEMGHVLGLGHNNWSNGAGTLVMYAGLVNQEGKLLFNLRAYDKIGIDAYWIHQGYMENPANELEANPISRYLNRQHFFFDYEPEILFYFQRQTKEKNVEGNSEKSISLIKNEKEEK